MQNEAPQEFIDREFALIWLREEILPHLKEWAQRHLPKIQALLRTMDARPSHVVILDAQQRGRAWRTINPHAWSPDDRRRT